MAKELPRSEIKSSTHSKAGSGRLGPLQQNSRYSVIDPLQLLKIGEAYITKSWPFIFLNLIIYKMLAVFI